MGILVKLTTTFRVEINHQLYNKLYVAEREHIIEESETGTGAHTVSLS